MIARRDVLKLAAALSAGRALPALPSPAEAARLLALPAAEPPSAEPDASLHDPAGFAEDLNGWMSDEIQTELTRMVCPEHYAAYLAARTALLASLPILHDVRFDHPYHKMDEATHAIMCVAYTDGLRHGAAYEGLRRSLLGPVRTCERCEAVGLLGADGRAWRHGEATACGKCGGHGTVAA